MKELRQVYSAPTEEAALIYLDKLEENWGKKYSLSIRTFRQNWADASTFFNYHIREII
jgi:transposase-like protein